MTRISELLRRARRSFYNWWFSRRLHVPPHYVDISGPCLIHGGGQFRVGRNVSIRSTSRQPVELYCMPGGVLTLRDACFLNQGVHLACSQSIEIGEQCLLADEVLVMDSDFHGVAGGETKSAPVILERGVWVGARAIILKGVTVGSGAVIGAGAIVTRSVPPRSLAVGNPAHLVRQW